uniref:IC97/Casc1 N-terminal domain-containing protein n=1 Tax=Pyramimonas obovata TaxID=1411642 RepID=A0A6T7W6T2_9CHLO|mmetsp:Transcript_26/g.54  ORF Transcript_26/g.54 Transcript_26/m.54 type:complete len:652 (-) Transcript_26:297-2252(-)|eukprot:CAMPEP_0118936022 /NCGR_PEP_ID=MMETSP1169-20130426/15962_1 /TAXON_ID=36882 /ORGANISM="Pyramimonas obovata, Strain CCMP722" /LENGTH=651 /DNA_ID=CAMNT_0006879113 /DNA_START=280 /DNA_END=2235 /DNA_ORIENTATION=+
MAKGAAKGKGKKKAEELEAARLAAAEEAARLEAERLKLEEEERIKAEAEKAERLKVEGARLAVEAARLQSERDEEIPLHSQRKNALQVAHAATSDQIEWDRYIDCVPRPNPLFDSDLNGYLLTLQERAQKVLDDTLGICQDNELIVKESLALTLFPSHFDCSETRERQCKYAEDIRALSTGMIDSNTAHILQHADEFLSPSAQAAQTAQNVLVHSQVDQFKMGLWVNLAKNPRQRAVEIEELGFQVELPKSLLLASIAVRLLHMHYDSFTPKAKNEYMAVGGVFTVDLLSLPPLPKKVKGWTIRQVTPLATNVQKLPYPIPPAGGEMAASSANLANVLPMGLTFSLPKHVLLLEEEPEVGWWDTEEEKWQTDGITDVKYDAEAHSLSFSTTKLLSLGLLLSRIKLLPYDYWHYRPTSATTGVVSLTPENNPFPDPIMIHVSEGGCKLLLPDRPALRPLMEEERPAALLLRLLTDSGVPLLPEDRDAEHASMDVKKAEVEKALCADLALLGSTFMFASSTWNRDATDDDCIFRLKELADFARCEERDAVKVFSKHKEGGLITVLRKAKGVAELPITDADPKMPETMDLQITPHEDISWEQEGLEPLYFAASIRQLLKDKMMPETMERIECASPTFTENLHHLMYTLRLFSFT